MNKKNESVTRFMLVLLAASFFDVVQGCESTITRRDFERNVDIVCCSVTCPKDHQVKKCKVNGSADTCEPCPQGTFMDDATDSKYPLQCESYNCPPESIPAKKKSDTGCLRKCVCDVERGYVGTDPCICIQSQVTCPEGTLLTIYNNCTEMKVSTTSNGIVTTKAMDTTAYQEQRPEVTESNVTVNPVVMTTPSPGNVSPKNVAWIFFVFMVVVVVVVAVYGCKVRICKKLPNNTENVNANGGGESFPGEMIPLTKINGHVHRDTGVPHTDVHEGGERSSLFVSGNNGHVTKETGGSGGNKSIPSCEHNGNITGDTENIDLSSAPDLNMKSLWNQDSSIDMDPAPKLVLESLQVNI